ncbi:MAG TPA: M13 family metallopeptidase [Steroidobacteraceae bacterium]|jgi:predicted metalloendopeptidase|nr:M13 family metallopeptidase [Steroidobacteraceae bacterium]
MNSRAFNPHRCVGVALALVLLSANAPAQAPAGKAPALTSGLDLAAMDKAVRVQDDVYQYANGHWLKNTPIPDDRSSVSIASELLDKSLDQLHGLIEAAAKNTRDPAGSEAHKIGDLYASFMDEAAVEAAGLGALKGELTRIDAVKSKTELPALFAHLNRIGVSTPYGVGVGPDVRDTTRNAAGVDQDGLGMPDRDYYIKNDDPRLVEIRGRYLKAIEKLMSLAGQPDAAAQAKAVLALETRMAKAQWTRTELRDPVKTYNKVTLKTLDGHTPGFQWQAYLDDTGISGKTDYLIVGEPSYFKAFGAMIGSEPLPVWKSYLRWHLILGYAEYMPKRFVDAHFQFYGTDLRGTVSIRPRWKRGVALVDGSIGEGLGKLYVGKYFPPDTKGRMEKLVDNLLTAYRQDVNSLDWMGPETKKQALEKLAKLHRKIGYPDHWRDYSGLVVRRDDLIGNVMRANAFEFDYQLGKLGKPVDHGEWQMTPQTINAYYRPDLNEIVFPAAFLQPPNFDPKADDASNYGAIGAVIGHEMSHGFDDEGSQFDSNGNLRDWWSKQDHERFAAKTAALVAQYDAFEAMPGYHINGKLTLGENIADNSGLAVAYKAYRLTLNGRQAPVIDGYTGDQRFFLAFAQVWAGKVRDKQQIVYLKSDPHSPYAARGSLPLRNQDAFYTAFGIKPTDKMYLPPDKRVHIW